MRPIAAILGVTPSRVPRAVLGCLLIASMMLCATSAIGSTVNFWLSNSVPEPVAPNFTVPAGAISTIDIWVQLPDNATLNGFSLNLASEQSGAIEFTDVRVHNPVYASENHRHQFVFDSGTQLLNGVMYNDLFLEADFIEKFVGMAVLPGGEGIGPDCDSADTMYCTASSGGPAWRIARITFEAGMAGMQENPFTELYLEIGEHGLWLEGENSTNTDAIFGADGVVRTWDASDYPDVPQNHTGWVPDAIINVVPSDADFDDDGDVDGRDFLIWQRGYGGTLHTEGDANGDQLVDGADLAIWQAQYGGAAAPLAAFAAVPEPSSSLILALLLLCPAARNMAKNAGFRGIC